MRNYWLVARQEYLRMVLRRGFLVGTLAIPLGMAVLIGVVILVEVLGESDLPIGYVDHAGLLNTQHQDRLADVDQPFGILPYPDEALALAALEREEIQAFFVLPADYRQTLKTDLYYLEKPPSNDVRRAFRDFLRLNLVADFPEETQTRLLEGPSITVRDIASGRVFSQRGIINIILPFAASFFFIISTMSSVGYMLGVVADEKENRTMEIMLTSLTPGELIGGKAVGLLAAALTQLSIYILAIIIGLNIAAPYVAVLREAIIPWGYIGVMALFFFPAYALMAAVMVAIGGAVTEIQQGQQIAGILNLLFMLPLFVLPFLMADPGGPLFVVLTFLPTTAFMTISLRWGLGTIPVWQLGASWVLLITTTLVMIWAAARIFRAGMLRYGQPLNFRAVITAVRGG